MKQVIIALFLFFLNIFLVNAVGVGTPYLPDNTLFLAPNESYIYNINIQNGENVSVFAEAVIIEGHSIASFVNPKQVYFLAPKTYDFLVPVLIKIPEKDLPNKKYVFSYFVKISQELENSNDGVSFGMNFPGTVIVKVKDTSEPFFLMRFFSFDFYKGIFNKLSGLLDKRVLFLFLVLQGFALLLAIYYSKKSIYMKSN